MCILPLLHGQFILDWWDPTINCVPSTLWQIYWLPIYFIFMPDTEWSKQLGAVQMVCCKVCHVSWLLAQWRDVNVMRKPKPANQMQSEALKHVPEHSITGWKLRSYEVSVTYVWPSNLSLPNLLKLCEASWRLHEVILRTSFNYILWIHFRCNQKHWSMFLNTSSQAENYKALECWRIVFGLVINLPPRISKLCEVSWRLHEIILRSGLTEKWLGKGAVSCDLLSCWSRYGSRGYQITADWPATKECKISQPATLWCQMCSWLHWLGQNGDAHGCVFVTFKL